MTKHALLAMLVIGGGMAGCAMFTSWKSIPPPGGCDQCHTVAISTNWQVAYHPATVSDERTRQAFQTPEYNLAQQGKQASPMETKKIDELRCFECHKSPTPAHRERMGRFHH